VPTLNILASLKVGIAAGCTKGLGTTALANAFPALTPAVVYDREIREAKLTPDELSGVMPMSTSWVCTSAPGTGGFQVDAVRGPSIVDVVIATPWPMPQSRLWCVLGPDLDALWTVLHGTEAHVDVFDMIERLPPWPNPPNPES